MIADKLTPTEKTFTFSVDNISKLHELLSCVDKRLVNKFIMDIRQAVSAFHSYEFQVVTVDKVKREKQFFSNLNNRAHQLARFTSDLSHLVHKAPQELFEEARHADRAIDDIHGSLVNLCLAIDNLSKHKKRFIHDDIHTIQVIYDSYCEAFSTTPNARDFDDMNPLPDDATVEDLLIPVVEFLMLKDHYRALKLVQRVVK
jgi:hypothetical protein